MRDISSADLRKRRRQLLGGLPSFERIMRGSLVERYKRCGRPGCHCANDRGHGPKHYLSVSATGQRPQMDYVPNASHAVVSEYLANFHKLREVLNEICAINTELLRRREEFD
jgi:Family of unknown function (DUF6788)